MKFTYDYLKGIIDATTELNKLAGIESTTISFGTAETENVGRLTAIWESDCKITASADYWNPQETETVFSTEHLDLSEKTTILNIVEFITDCTEQAMRDEYNNL